MIMHILLTYSCFKSMYTWVHYHEHNALPEQQQNAESITATGAKANQL